MNTTSRIAVLKGDNFVCLRIIGRANFHSSIDFKTVVQKLCNRGCPVFILELSQCPHMDSTFLGVLTGLGLQMRNPEDPETVRIELLNPNERILELLETLGVLHLFRVSHGPGPCLQNTEEPAEPQKPASKLDLSKACLEAHKTLMDLNPENAARFKDVAQFLAEEIRNS